MPSARTTLERIGDRVPVPEPAFDRLLRRRDRKRRNQRITAVAVAVILALVSMSILVRSFRGTQRPANEPTPAPKPEGIFANVAGWIAYGNRNVKQGPLGIWAVDPTRPNDPEARIQLSDRPGEPLAWSSDGSKLLIWRVRRLEGPAASPVPRLPSGKQLWTGLFVLNADGTETRLVVPRLGARYIFGNGSFSPDGSKVAFATTGGMYTVDADGGTPRILAEAGVNPTYSPNGTKIAYFDIDEGQGHTLRVMNADGTGDRMLLDGQAVDCYYPSWIIRPAWSPDGTHIAFSCYEHEHGIRVVNADGSGLRTVIPNGLNPYWSPDGSRIAFDPSAGIHRVGRLAIANADGTHIQLSRYQAHAGPWNPLLPAVPGNATSTGSGLATPLIFAIALVVVVGVLIGGRRVRANIGAKR
jgi:Tol biopolymer transport system component